MVILMLDKIDRALDFIHAVLNFEKNIRYKGIYGSFWAQINGHFYFNIPNKLCDKWWVKFNEKALVLVKCFAFIKIPLFHSQNSDK